MASSTQANPVSHVIIWGAGAMFLIILADFYPKVAVGLTALLLASVLLINGQKYGSIIGGIKP